LFPYHWRANNLILECNAAIARGEDVPLGFGMEMLIPIVAIIAGVAVIAVVSVILVQKRRTRSASDE
jgi:hypothetical protein